LEGNEKAQGLYIIFDEKRERSLKGASEAGRITLTPPLDLVQGYRAFIAYVPLYVEGDFDGFMVGIFDIQKLLENYLPAGFLDGHYFALEINGKTAF